MSEPPFPSPWPVKPDAAVEDFSVKVPRLTWLARLAQEMGVEDPSQVASPNTCVFICGVAGFEESSGNDGSCCR